VAQTSGGYVHIVDFTDPMKPKAVGRYHLEDFGSHDIIVEDDILYQAYYEAASGWWTCRASCSATWPIRAGRSRSSSRTIPKASRPNASFVMNAMPWKGHVLFTDFNSGLWARAAAEADAYAVRREREA
jgi:hypothetical protein